MKTYLIESYGCQMNMAESVALENRLTQCGLEKVEDPENADIVIINTCAVRKSAEDRIWGRLGLYAHLKKSHPFTLVVTGCMAQHLLASLKKEAPQVDYAIAVNDKQKIVDIALGRDWMHNENYAFDTCSWHPGDISSFVPIMNGCDNFCSYCIVPYVRGRETSRRVSDILDEVRFLDAHGVKEITLLGQNVNSYRSLEGDGEVRFPELLTLVCKECKQIGWIRFESPHPKDFSEDLIKIVRDEGRVAKHLHLPLQSGNTRILGLMNRHYTQEQFLTLLDSIREEIPSVTFAVDVMVGFPSESEDEFNDTLDVLKKMRATEPFMYYYNEREGTRATTMDGKIDEETKGRRLSQLIVLQQEITRKEKEKRIGSITKVLVTQPSKHDGSEMLAHSEHNEMVVLKTCVPVGSFLTVRLDALKGNTFTGTVLED